jgi:hypothetical protein
VIPLCQAEIGKRPLVARSGRSFTKSGVGQSAQTGAPDTAYSLSWADDKVAKPILSNGVGLGGLIKDISNQTEVGAEIDAHAWKSSGYKPTPTIIEAAQALYQGHRVVEITRSDAGAINLSQTAECIA